MEPDLAQVLATLSTGIYVMTVRDGVMTHGMSSSWVTQVSGEPPLLVAAVDCRHATHAVVRRTGLFALNVVGTASRHLEDYFYSERARRPDNLEGLALEGGRHGLPLLTEAAANLECRVAAEYGAGDHSLFVAAVDHVTLRAEQRPLTSLDLDYAYVGTLIRRNR